MPHEPETADDVTVSRLLARDAAHKIVHGANAVEELAAIGADTDRISVIPHGAYTGSYREANRTESRRTLGLPGSARIVMFFGQIRPYKGLADLIPAWDEVTATGDDGDPAPFLLIAGKCDDDGERVRLQREVGERNGRFDEGYASHEKVPLYFAAADIVVLPFRQVTTSGSAVLALSLGRPIVAPRIGALRDLPMSVGFLYEDGALVAALARALGATSEELAARSRGSPVVCGRTVMGPASPLRPSTCIAKLRCRRVRATRPGLERPDSAERALVAYPSGCSAVLQLVQTVRENAPMIRP